MIGRYGKSDNIDRILLAELRRDATQPYAALGAAAGLSAGSAHDRVRKLRERGIIRRTTIDIDPAALGLDVLAYVFIDGNAWLGDTVEAFAAIPEIEEAHIVAGQATVLAKVRASTTRGLQDILRRIFDVPGVVSTQTIVVLDPLFDRGLTPQPDPPPPAGRSTS